MQENISLVVQIKSLDHGTMERAGKVLSIDLTAVAKGNELIFWLVV